MNKGSAKNLDYVSLASAFVAFIAYLFLSFWILSEGHLHEDAYILFTYVEHLADGDGIVYFENGERAEGATDFLWMVILAFLNYLGVDAGVAAAFLNGIGIGLIAYLLVLNLGWERQAVSRILAGLLFSVLLIASDIAAASASGFSTAFYVSIVVLTAHIYLHAQASKMITMPWVSLLLGLIRPDGVIIGLFASFVGIERVWNTKYKTLYFYNMAGAGLLGATYFAWRFSYFEHLLPLPLYVKSYSEARFPGLGANVGYLLDQTVLLFAAGLALTLARDMRRYVLALVPAVGLLVALVFAHQSQNVAHRFQAPVSGILLLAFAQFLGAYLKNAVPWKRLIVMMGVFPIVATGTSVDPKLYRYLIDYDYINYFPFLARDILDERVTLALTEAGRMAYWTDAKTYDLVGLNTSYIATKKLDLGYVERISPDVIFIHTAGTLRPFDVDGQNVFEVTAGFIGDRRIENIDWRQVYNPVKRAPYVVYEYLEKQAGEYKIVFVRYEKAFVHLYAVKKDGIVEWSKFLEKMELSFSDKERKSYLNMKRYVD